MNEMSAKHAVLLSAFVLSGCFGSSDSQNNNDPNTGGGGKPIKPTDPTPPTVPDLIPSLLFTSPVDNNTYFINKDIEIKWAELPVTGYLELDINGTEKVQLLSPYEHVWRPNNTGQYILNAKYYSSENALIAEGKIELTIVPANEEVITVNSNLHKIVDVQLGESLTLTAESSVPLGQVDFLFNGQTIKTFMNEPYTMEWVPTDVRQNNFTIQATPGHVDLPIVLPEPSVIRSFLPETIAFCNEKAKPWVVGTQYHIGDHVKHNNRYFIAEKTNAFEPTMDPSQFNPWSHISCANMAWLTKPSVNVLARGGRFNSGDELPILVYIRPSVDPSVEIIEVQVKRNNKVIKVLPNVEDQQYMHTFVAEKVSFPEYPKDIITVSARNNLNQENEVEVEIFGNHSPKHEFKIEQAGSTYPTYSSTSPILFSSLVMDIENKVEKIEYYINDELYDYMDSSENVQPIETEKIIMQVELSPGTYRIRAVAIDGDLGTSEVRKIISVR